jgi:methyl-accepting chemotaxis protein
MLSGAKDQAARIESSTAAVTELSSSIQTVADNAIQATKVAKEAGDNAERGIASMGKLHSSFEDTADKIHQLGESSKRIGNIVDVIRQISEQTSLLALNASIEAAHAGEQGRGFAVVADEVSSLAKRVGQSAKDIEGLIGTISEQTQQAVQSMQAGMQQVELGTGGVTATLGSLKQIAEVISDTARSVQEQAVVSDEIARNMDAVQKIAQEVLGSSEEAVVQGEQLHALALKLEELVREFRVERDGGNGARTLGAATTAALPERSTDRRKTARG